ncbi:MAG: DNA-binding response regulator [Cyanobacteria bacterium PR.3.49]|jgi:DNA-binding response OmpR family regulator|nr:DNA-binding response regulator [Cyanobacteria bacterium PR.3.49]
MAKIVVVEDDKDLVNLIKGILSIERHTIDSVHDGHEALAIIQMHPYDLVILDWMLPGRSGTEICRDYRARGGSAPILMLTAKAEVDDRAEGLDSGADDYLTKPFHPKEFSARVRALLRRPQAVMGKTLKAADIELDPGQIKVFKSGQEIHLLPKEFALLELFLRYPTQVFSAEALLDRVWNTDSSASLDTVRTYIKTLRKKIDSNPKDSLIRTVHGVGYSLSSKAEQG